jgi:hypothetical protein
MKHLSSIVLVAAVVAAGTVACFKDPTSGLRKGATRIELTQSAITLVTGDSLAIQAEVKDAQGNTYDAGTVEWTSGNPAIATVVKDDHTYIPYGAFSKAFVLATADTNGGSAYVFAAYGGIKDSLRVLVLPVGLTATAAAIGTARADTIGAVVINAGDTLSITSTSGVRFDLTGTQITLGAKRAYVFSRTPTQVKAVALAPFSGRPWVTTLWYQGSPEVGLVALADSMQANTVAVSRPRYYPTITVTGDTMFVPAPAGTTFDTLTSAVRFGTADATVFVRTASQLKVLNQTGSSYTGRVTVRNVKLGVTTLDSLVSVVPSTVQQYTAGYTGTVTQTGDTMLLAPSTGTTFDAQTSTVKFGANAGAVLARSATQLKVIAPVATPGSSDTLKVTNVHLGLATVNLQSTAVTYTIQRATFSGAVTQTGDTLFIAPPTGFSFDSATATVSFGASSGIVLAKSSSSIKVLSPVTYTGPVTVKGVKMGIATVNLATTGSYTINAANFNATVTTLGKYLDTVKVYAAPGFKFTTTPAASASNVMIGGAAAWVLLRTADSMYVISRMPSAGQIGVTNGNVGGTVIGPALFVPGNVVITANPTGEANEPANNTPGAVVINFLSATAANPDRKSVV